MTWTCEQTEARLSDYLDGLLTPDERRAFDMHANTCENCVQIVASVSHLVSGLRSMEQIAPPPQLVTLILNQTIGPRETKKGWRVAFGWLGGLASPRFAYSAVSIAASAAILLAASGISLRKPKLADFSLVNIARNVDRQAHLAYAHTTKFVSDLRVVYEIQSRLNQDNTLPATPETTMPQTTPGKAPGSTDSTRPDAPRQQNRANSIRRELEVLATEVPSVGSAFCGRMLTRSIP
ncbi:MAG: zf-HC2 domain-containing protein [Candidatus Acidiferrum sp.]